MQEIDKSRGNEESCINGAHRDREIEESTQRGLHACRIPHWVNNGHLDLIIITLFITALWSWWYSPFKSSQRTDSSHSPSGLCRLSATGQNKETYSETRKGWVSLSFGKIEFPALSLAFPRRKVKFNPKLLGSNFTFLLGNVMFVQLRILLDPN